MNILFIKFKFFCLVGFMVSGILRVSVFGYFPLINNVLLLKVTKL